MSSPLPPQNEKPTNQSSWWWVAKFRLVQTLLATDFASLHQKTHTYNSSNTCCTSPCSGKPSASPSPYSSIPPLSNQNFRSTASKSLRLSVSFTSFTSSTSFTSVFRHLRIHLVRPRQYPALQIVDLPETRLSQEVHRFRRPLPAPAMRHNLSRRVQLVHPPR